MSKHERLLLLLATILGSVVLFPVTVFVLMALWPQRVLVSWLLLGLVTLAVVARIAVWLIRAVTCLPAHERGSPREAWSEQRFQVQTPHSSHGLIPLSMEQDQHWP